MANRRIRRHGLEGAVAGLSQELQAIEDPAERAAAYEKMVADMYKRKAVNIASLELDDVIDPAETRHWIARGLKSVPAKPNVRVKTPERGYVVAPGGSCKRAALSSPARHALW